MATTEIKINSSGQLQYKRNGSFVTQYCGRDSSRACDHNCCGFEEPSGTVIKLCGRRIVSTETIVDDR